MSDRPKKLRADDLVVQAGLADTRSRARSLIMMGKIVCNGRIVAKAGDFLPADAVLEMQDDIPYVSRGGLKLEGALRYFGIGVRGCVALDAGASTGGFTDCLLQHGASRVYAVDVGYGIIDAKLRADSRVVVIERTNIRHMDAHLIPDPVDLVVVDVSFISLTLVVPKLLGFLKPGGDIVALVKPQFELTPKEIGKGGIVRDEALRQKAVEKIRAFFIENGATVVGVVEAEVKGQKGNQEYLLYARKGQQ